MIKKANKNDIKIIANLTLLLWPNHNLKELEQEFLELLESENSAIFLKYMNENAVGFAHVNLRNDYVEGTSSSSGLFRRNFHKKRISQTRFC